MTSSSSDSSAPRPGLFDDPIGTLRLFLARGATGCKFAAAFAGATTGPISWAELSLPESPDDDAAKSIEDAFAAAAAKQHAVGIIFPTARDEDDLVKLVAVLHQMPRWTIRELVGRGRPSELPDEVAVFSALWKTDHDESASVMVLAPFGWMPVHRRAPYVTLMSWTGTRSNTMQKKKLRDDLERAVGFIDMPVHDHTNYDKMWSASLKNAKQLRGHVGAEINHAAGKDVAFSASPAAAVMIRAVINHGTSSSLSVAMKSYDVPFTVLAAVGFVASLCTHLAALNGTELIGPNLVLALHVGTFIVFAYAITGHLRDFYERDVGAIWRAVFGR